MPEQHIDAPQTGLESLRRRLAELESENAQLKGRGLSSRGDIDLLRQNTNLRRRVESLRATLPDADMAPTLDGGAHLTIHQVASRLNTTAAGASRLLAKVETRTDRNGVEVIAADRFEQFILDTAGGNHVSRFL